MSNNLLPKKFFRDNPLEEMSSPAIALFSMEMGFNEKLQSAVQDILDQGLDPERKTQIKAEQEKISQLETGEEVVKFIRNNYDIVNRDRLCKKALTMQAEVMPLLLRRFRTSFQDNLVETAVYILAYAEPEYVDQLITMYPEIRNPYAQSMACVVLGVQKREETLPLLLREYERFMREYPEESFDQGPLLAIYRLDGRA